MKKTFLQLLEDDAFWLRPTYRSILASVEVEDPIHQQPFGIIDAVLDGRFAQRTPDVLQLVSLPLLWGRMTERLLDKFQAILDRR